MKSTAVASLGEVIGALLLGLSLEINWCLLLEVFLLVGGVPARRVILALLLGLSLEMHSSCQHGTGHRCIIATVGIVGIVAVVYWRFTMGSGASRRAGSPLRRVCPRRRLRLGSPVFA